MAELGNLVLSTSAFTAEQRTALLSPPPPQTTATEASWSLSSLPFLLLKWLARLKKMRRGSKRGGDSGSGIGMEEFLRLKDAVIVLVRNLAQHTEQGMCAHVLRLFSLLSSCPSALLCFPPLISFLPFFIPVRIFVSALLFSFFVHV